MKNYKPDFKKGDLITINGFNSVTQEFEENKRLGGIQSFAPIQNGRKVHVWEAEENPIVDLQCGSGYSYRGYDCLWFCKATHEQVFAEVKRLNLIKEAIESQIFNLEAASVIVKMAEMKSRKGK